VTLFLEVLSKTAQNANVECKCEVWVVPKNLILGDIVCVPCAYRMSRAAVEQGEKVYYADAVKASTELN